MKAYKSVLGVFLAGIVAVVAFSGCSEATEPTNESASGQFVEYTELTSYDLVIGSMEIEDATFENEVRVKPDRGAMGPTDSRGPRDDRPDGGMRHPFGRLLNALNLTEEQRLQVAELLKTHHDCIKSAHDIYREHVSEIMTAAREAHKGIMASYRNGEISREEARAQLQQLNRRVREALKNSNALARVREMMKACDDEFFRSLAAILDDEQRVLLRRYIASLQE